MGPSGPSRVSGSARPFRSLATLGALAVLAGSLSGCAAGGRRFGTPAPDTAARAPVLWADAVRRADPGADANVLYDAALSQGVLSTSGTLAVRLRGDFAEGTLAGPMGAPIASYRDGVLRGEKIEPVRLPPDELRAVLAGVWRPDGFEVAGQRESEVLLRWTDREPSEGVFDLARGELLRLTVRRPEGEIEARFAGARSPWPERIEIDEKRTGSRLKLRMIARESPS